MNRFGPGLTLILALLAVRPAGADIFFWKSKKNMAQRVPQLLATLKTDLDDGKRESAAKELRDFDPTKHPDIVPSLIDVAHNDPKPGVRIEAVASLGKLRPISQDAGLAIEEATKDSSVRVRVQAQRVLMSYRLSGYRSPSSVSSDPAGAAKPSKLRSTLLNPLGRLTGRSNSPAKDVTTPATPAQTNAPPTAPARAESAAPRRLPRGPSDTELVPTSNPKLRPVPTTPAESVPELPPPDGQ